MSLAVLLQVLGNLVKLAIFPNKFIHRRVVHGLDSLDQITHAVAVDRKSEAHFRRDLVPLGHRDFSHIVTKAGELRAL